MLNFVLFWLFLFFWDPVYWVSCPFLNLIGCIFCCWAFQFADIFSALILYRIGSLQIFSPILFSVFSLNWVLYYAEALDIVHLSCVIFVAYALGIFSKNLLLKPMASSFFLSVSYSNFNSTWRWFFFKYGWYVQDLRFFFCMYTSSFASDCPIFTFCLGTCVKDQLSVYT